MKNKIVVAIITVALSASIGAGAMAAASHFITKVPASNVAAAQTTEVNAEDMKAEEEAAKKAAEKKAAEEKAAKEAAEKKAAAEKAAKEAAEEKAAKAAAEKKAAEEEAARKAAKLRAAEEQAAKEAAEKKAAEEEAARKAAEHRAAEEEAARRAAEKKAAEEEAARKAAEAENAIQYVTGTVTSMDGNRWQIRSEGCSITLQVAGTEMYIQDYVTEGDEITVVIKGQMKEDGWKVIQVYDYTVHEDICSDDLYDDDYAEFDDDDAYEYVEICEDDMYN